MPKPCAATPRPLWRQVEENLNTWMVLHAVIGIYVQAPPSLLSLSLVQDLFDLRRGFQRRGEEGGDINFFFFTCS